MSIFAQRKGIIVACDVTDLESLSRVVHGTHDLSFICAYKIGVELALSFGVARAVETITRVTPKPVIYDHQKFGTDIPEICGGQVLTVLKQAGVGHLIVFPLAGIETLRATVAGCGSTGIIPIVGGEMTHKGYLRADGGYIDDTSPARIYADAAELGVQAFVVPGTKLDSVRRYRRALQSIVPSPVFLFPGIGKGQGGDIVEAFDAVAPFDAYAIVGRGIYAHPDPRSAAVHLWSAVSNKFGDNAYNLGAPQPP